MLALAACKGDDRATTPAPLTNAGLAETWLVREDCRRAEQVDLTCICRGG